MSAGRLGMAIFIVSLSVVFAAVLIGCLVLRWTVLDMQPGGGGGAAADALAGLRLPGWLWLSTALIILSGFPLSAARRALGRGATGRARRLVLLTLALALGFLVTQGLAWWSLHESLRNVPRPDAGPSAVNLAITVFDLVTILHGIHVLGGLAPLAWLSWRVHRDTSRETWPITLNNLVMYWRFLEVVWVVLLIVLLAW